MGMRRMCYHVAEAVRAAEHIPGAVHHVEVSRAALRLVCDRSRTTVKGGEI